MKTDKEAATIAYSENLHNARQNWDKGQHVGMPQNHKEINAQVEGFQDGWDAGCKHKEESRWIPVSEMAAHNQYAWVSNGPNGYVLWACYAQLVGWFDESGKQIHGVTQYWPVIKPTPPQTNK